jgi:hypothetical protein
MTETRKLSDRQYFIIIYEIWSCCGNLRNCWLRLQTLLELVDYVNSAKQPFAEHIMPEVVNMVEQNPDNLSFICTYIW